MLEPDPKVKVLESFRDGQTSPTRGVLGVEERVSMLDGSRFSSKEGLRSSASLIAATNVLSNVLWPVRVKKNSIDLHIATDVRRSAGYKSYSTN